MGTVVSFYHQLSRRRQVAEALAKFRPTRGAVEYPRETPGKLDAARLAVT